MGETMCQIEAFGGQPDPLLINIYSCQCKPV